MNFVEPLWAGHWLDNKQGVPFEINKIQQTFGEKNF